MPLGKQTFASKNIVTEIGSLDLVVFWRQERSRLFHDLFTFSSSSTKRHSRHCQKTQELHKLVQIEGRKSSEAGAFFVLRRLSTSTVKNLPLLIWFALWILQIDKCFGFDTAVEEAQRALMAAKVEAMSAYRGIGIVKLMGRQSGFIAMQVKICFSILFSSPHLLKEKWLTNSQHVSSIMC